MLSRPDLMRMMVLILLFLMGLVRPSKAGSDRVLDVFCGSAVNPPLEEIARKYQDSHRVKVIIHSGGSGTVLSQMRIAQQGDLYIPGSPDFMEKAMRHDSIYPETIKVLAYLIPVINVPKGNPQKIKGLEDLTRPGLRLGIANPHTVCVGLYAAEILEYNQLSQRVLPNIVTQAASCQLTASLVVLRAVDAVLGWDVFGRWRPDKIENIYLRPDQIPRIAYIPAAISRYTKNKPLAESFLQYLVSGAGRGVFARFGYITRLEEAKLHAPRAKVGGQYHLPEYW